MATKQQIIDKISRIEDPELLDELDEWISSLLEAVEGEKFSEEEISAVQEGYEQYLAGDIVDQKQANKLFDEWLKGK